MSSQDDHEVMSETTPLLDSCQQTGPSMERFGFLPETLVIPVMFATSLAAQMPTTTLVELVRLAVCRLSTPHDDNITPLAGDRFPSDICDSPEVVRNFSIAIAILGAAEGIMGVASCGIMSRISSYYGRRPAFLFLLATGAAGTLLIPLSQHVPELLSDWVFLMGLLSLMFSSLLPFSYLGNTYVVDVCLPEDRTAALSKIKGWSTLAGCITLALGGSITTKTDNPSIVFYLAAAAFILAFIYVLPILPESFSREKRNEFFSRQRGSSFPASTRSASLLTFLGPLKILYPMHMSSGTRNWRLTWCALHLLTFMLVNAYTPTAWLVLVTSKYHLSPAQTGLFLSIVAASSTVVLTMITPPLIRFLRLYYSRGTLRFLREDGEDVRNVDTVLGTSDHLDVHLGIVSCVIAAITYLCAAASTSDVALITSGVCAGFVTIHVPTTRSLAAGSVDPLQQSEALAAVEMTNSMGAMLSPIIMGSILTMTINTAPLLTFVVHAVVALASTGFLLLIRDADRFKGLAD